MGLQDIATDILSDPETSEIHPVDIADWMESIEEARKDAFLAMCWIRDLSTVIRGMLAEHERMTA